LLLPKEEPFRWDEEQEESFLKSRDALQETNILIHADSKAPFYLATDACDVGMGAVPLQKRHGELRPIQFGSKGLSSTQRKYSAPQRECLAMIWGIERFHYCLSGRKCTLMIDSESLEWLKELKGPSKMLFLWTMRLNEYDCEVLPKAGKDNGDADGLSGFQVFYSFFTYEEMNNFVINSKIPKEITKAEGAKSKKASKNFRFAGNSLLIQNGGEWLLHPSPEERPVLIKQYRERSHQSASTVTENLKLRNFWAKMDAEVAELVAQCLCARGKSRVTQKATLIFPRLSRNCRSRRSQPESFKCLSPYEARFCEQI
jgi:hypothetical protein